MSSSASLVINSVFLSTLSLRRATERCSGTVTDGGNFYPRSPCGERRHCSASSGTCPCNFYPRSPCGERPAPVRSHVSLTLFLSTLSLRRATCLCEQNHYSGQISIHALLAESDKSAAQDMKSLLIFLSTLSLRRATPGRNADRAAEKYFYPRSPCGERPPAPAAHSPQRYFYPRSPCGERRRGAVPLLS